MQTNTLLEQLRQHEDRWVALLEPDKKVVGSGADASAARADAAKRGYPDVILLKVLPFDAGYVPHV